MTTKDQTRRALARTHAALAAVELTQVAIDRAELEAEIARIRETEARLGRPATADELYPETY